MAIKYYPNRIYKKPVPAIDRVIAKRSPVTERGTQNILATDLDVIISPESDWQIDSIAFEFSNAIARNYSASVRNGRRVVENLNDYLWFKIDNTFPQMITLDSGFYDGTELAAELKSKMDANSAFAAKGVTFTVVYDPTTGLYTVTPSSGNIAYVNVNQGMTLRTRDSIAGHLFGFNVDGTLAATAVSDTAVPGLNTQMALINEVGSVALTDYQDDLHILSVDQALYLGSNSGVNVTIDYTVVYEVIV